MLVEAVLTVLTELLQGPRGSTQGACLVWTECCAVRVGASAVASRSFRLARQMQERVMARTLVVDSEGDRRGFRRRVGYRPGSIRDTAFPQRL